jgi:ethanolamine ammonia-lyase large subunit
VQRILRANQAVGREAVHSDLRLSELAPYNFRIFNTTALNKTDHLRNPELGSRLSPKTVTSLLAEKNDVQIIVADGLSAEAVHHNIGDLLPVLQDGLASRDYSMGQPALVPFGRVKLVEEIGSLLQPKLMILLIGERPGGDALSSRSLSAYLVACLEGSQAQKIAAEYSGNPGICYEYTLITNIYAGGLPAVEAGSVVAEKAIEILEHNAAGNRLEDILSTE